MSSFSFSWHSLLDILFVWFIFYQILLLIRGTRAFQMLVGILVFLILYLLSSGLKLYTLNWMITSFWSQLVLALLIVFQPEIRKALARVGKSPLLFGFSPAELPLDIDEIVKSVQTFSKRGVGAIMVLARGTDLSEITEIGVGIDAAISQELLISLFLPYSPLHDGAVIIRKNRIAAAGCFLPISLSPTVSRTLGTRHRAAIGITEETDAVALVVSEETGQISLVIAGRIHPVTDMTDLRNHLILLFRRESHSRLMLRATLMKKQFLAMKGQGVLGLFRKKTTPPSPPSSGNAHQ
ncbi:MAG: diadenylate cyclase CdaA [Leptospirales bacterium]